MAVFTAIQWERYRLEFCLGVNTAKRKKATGVVRTKFGSRKATKLGQLTPQVGLGNFSKFLQYRLDDATKCAC